MQTTSRFSQADARRFYDRFGAKQDTQGFYEDPALDALIDHGAFPDALSVLEAGCGTGRLAARLLADHLPDSARYVGLDISDTMVRLARNRLKPWADRAEVHLASGTDGFDAYGPPFDRFVSTYVFDLLEERDIRGTLSAAHGALSEGGLLCTAVLTWGEGFPSSLTSSVWSRIHRWRPALVGGCRPITLSGFLSEDQWRIIHHQTVSAWAVPSEVLVARAI